MNEADKPPVGRPRTFDRDRVIDVAMESYWREGVEGVSLNEVCRRADVSKPGLYREFGGEDGLMDAALERYTDVVLAPNFQLLSHDRPFGDVLADIVSLFTDIDRSGPAGCLLAKMQQTPTRLGPTVRGRVDDLQSMARAAYAEWIRHAQERSEVASDISPEVAAAFVEIQCTTLLVQMSLGEDPALLRAQAELAFAGLIGATPTHRQHPISKHS